MGIKQNKVKIYIDGANIFYTQKRLGWFIDWLKIKNIIEKEKEVAEWKYYVGVKDGDEKMMDYIKYLNNIGFYTVTKSLKKIKVIKDKISPKTQEREFIYKANFDVEMTADILLDKSKLDEIIIFSGDSDFRYLVKKLKDAGIKTMVYSSRKTISWELKLEISKIVYFEDIKDEILRQ